MIDRCPSCKVQVHRFRSYLKPFLAVAPLGVRLGCREGLPARPGHVRGPWWVQVVVVVGVGGVWAGRQEAVNERVR